MSQTYPLPGQYAGNTVQDHIDALRDNADLRTDGPLLDYLALAAAEVIEQLKVETTAGAVPRWLVHLVRTAAQMAEETACDEPGHDAGDDCDACAWDSLYQAVPQSVKAAVERAALAVTP
jgi:hypothetical protein